MPDKYEVLKQLNECVFGNGDCMKCGTNGERTVTCKSLVVNALELLKDKQKGHWAMNSNFPDRLICSECSSQFDVWHWESKQMHFCPNCGADMSENETH